LNYFCLICDQKSFQFINNLKAIDLMFIYLKSKQNLLSNSKQLLLSINRRLIQSNDSIFSNGSVLFSKSNDIFVNLSLEDWIYRNIDLNNKKILLLWTNRPSIVIGRHQNPWRECYVNRCIDNNIEIVRRNSGGGTVYHDFYNLNISFLSSKKLYNRKNNLIIIKDMLSKKFNIECEISKREDLVLKQTGNKISGTASKLGSTNSYHHCTLLIDVDLNRMKQFIRKESVGFSHLLLLMIC
jgi:lipoyltransferase 1